METAMYAQQNRSEHGDTTTRTEVIYGKTYIVVSHYAGKVLFHCTIFLS
ncbi:MAG: hypothetical protein SO434_05570 [Eubacteriales bacterium]|nr:hypothetical protein [Eubacteriales bacterium]